jgi:putative methionine-R-sulfoxide reductase with GAF domain
VSLDAQPYAGALAAVDRIVNREPEADEVLRHTVAALHDRIDDYLWVGISFVEDGRTELGPRKGESTGGAEHLEVPIVYDGRAVGMLGVCSGAPLTADDRAFLERVALLVSAHCLVGWDTGGVPWDELA